LTFAYIIQKVFYNKSNYAPFFLPKGENKEFFMKREKIDLKDDLVITKENVQIIGQKIAVCAVQNAKRFAYGSLDKLYRDLVYDINHKIQSDEIFTDGYDIAQESICYLCNFIGHKLGEVCVKNIHGKYDCIRLACYKHLYCYLRKQKKHILDEDSLEFEELNKIPVAFELDKEQEDFSKVNQTIRKLELTPDEFKVLVCAFNQMKLQDIADALGICRNTVINRKRIIREKYVACCQ
jgi:hypothetical protein